MPEPFAIQPTLPKMEDDSVLGAYFPRPSWDQYGAYPIEHCEAEPREPKDSANQPLRISPSLAGALIRSFPELSTGSTARRDTEALTQPPTEAEVLRILTGSTLGILDELVIVCMRKHFSLHPSLRFDKHGSPAPVQISPEDIGNVYPSAGLYPIYCIAKAVNHSWKGEARNSSDKNPTGEWFTDKDTDLEFHPFH